MPSSRPAASVDDVIVDPQPPAKGRSVTEETQALLGLSEVMARTPAHAVQRLVDSAMRLTGADSAGVSLEDTHESRPVFRWIAVAGAFTRYLGASMPRTASPCGTVVDRARTLIMREPARFFAAAADFHVPLHAVLLTPFGRAGKLVGTVWVVTHDPVREFSSDDVRIVEQLTTFSTSILDALQVRPGPGPAPSGAPGGGR